MTAPDAPKVIFPCRCWLAENEDDGKTSRVIVPGESLTHPYDSEYICNFLVLFLFCFFSIFFFKFWLIFAEHEILPRIRNIFTCFGCLLFSHWFVLFFLFACFLNFLLFLETRRGFFRCYFGLLAQGALISTFTGYARR